MTPTQILNHRSLLKQRLRSRERLFGAWISYDHPAIVETFALAGFDFIGIDMEHAPISLAAAQQIIAYSQAQGVPCLPRPVSHSNDVFKPLLDSGADGLLVQMVNTADEVEIISKSLKYPPEGARTYGVNRAQGYGLHFDSYIQSWNDSALLIVQIESSEGVANIESIVRHGAIDGVMIGPYDLSGSYGVPGQTNHHLVLEGAQHVIEACSRYGKSCGTQVASTDSASIESLFDQGYTYAILGSDLFILWKWAEQMQGVMASYRASL